MFIQITLAGSKFSSGTLSTMHLIYVYTELYVCMYVYVYIQFTSSQIWHTTRDTIFQLGSSHIWHSTHRFISFHICTSTCLFKFCHHHLHQMSLPFSPQQFTYHHLLYHSPQLCSLQPGHSISLSLCLLLHSHHCHYPTTTLILR